MNNKILTDLEREALEMLLAGDDFQLEILRRQLAKAVVSSREFTGVCFFTHFQVPSEIPRLSKRERITLDDIAVDIQGLQYGASIILFVDDGVLNFLEGVTPVEPWPDKIKNFKIYYLGEIPRGSGQLFPSPVRDLEWAVKDLTVSI